MKLTVIILTKNEELHIERAINSVHSICSSIYVIDSGSTDRTTEIARSVGAIVLNNKFINQAQQFNWALDQLPNDTQWVLRLDADEIITPRLAHSLSSFISTPNNMFAGAKLQRRIFFLQAPIRWGGVFPMEILRVFHYGKARSDERWMDEHILLDGNSVTLDGELHDINLRPLSWWIDKHNNYSSREVIEILNQRTDFLGRGQYALSVDQGGSLKKFLKNYIYLRFPLGLRAFIYFLYRYIFRFGFLDGIEGFAFHFLQGFWYRCLVDFKVHEVCLEMHRHRIDERTAIKKVLGLDLDFN